MHTRAMGLIWYENGHMIPNKVFNEWPGVSEGYSDAITIFLLSEVKVSCIKSYWMGGVA